MSDPQAEALNSTIAETHPQLIEMLSKRGKEIFFPAKGILGQTAEAKGKRINATIGIALEDDGSPLRLAAVEEQFQVAPKDAFPYAPSPGKAELREIWKEMNFAKNPSLAGKTVSQPVVTQALTHALSICGYLFMDEGDKVIMPSLFWGNYKLSFCNAYGAQLDTFETFVDGTFNLDGFQEKLNEGNPGKRIVLLNFPNNPSGYTPTEEEAAGIVDILVASATAGNKITVLVDDAYFGLVYKDGIYKESIFAPLADAHENILAVKIDGGTKEDYVWGLRVGFISYAIKGGTETLLKALEAKTAGAIRGNISNSPHISQTILLNAFSHPDYKSQKAEKFAILKGRYDKVVAIFAAHPEYADAFEAVPYNSGYFMCVKLKSADPETVRQLLLAEYDTGLIVAAGLIRVAYSSCAASVLDELFSNLYAAVKKVQV